MTRFPAPKTNFPLISTGALPPTAGQLAATGTGGGGGESHACAVSGKLFTLIHFGQAVAGASSSTSKALLLFVAAPRLLLEDAGEEEEEVAKEMASLGTPSFLRASFVPRLENMMAFSVALAVFGLEIDGEMCDESWDYRCRPIADLGYNETEAGLMSGR